MKTLPILSLIAIAASVAMAAPIVTEKDISTNALKAVANEAQKASLKRCEEARAKTEKERADYAKKVADQTKRNDAGMKKTIIKRHLNNMLPACDRAPEEPRDPGDYTIRF
ncbi:MAG: hypothetical protein IJB00_06255 [Akkermansia sp.]|nr:hypothetical protein [Akkermansia sp.]